MSQKNDLPSAIATFRLRTKSFSLDGVVKLGSLLVREFGRFGRPLTSGGGGDGLGRPLAPVVGLRGWITPRVGSNSLAVAGIGVAGVEPTGSWIAGVE